MVVCTGPTAAAALATQAHTCPEAGRNRPAGWGRKAQGPLRWPEEALDQATHQRGQDCLW